jgi:protein O-mannosyl-transferase
MGRRARAARQTRERSSPRRRWTAGAALLAVLTLAAYLPALQGGFVWDDDDYVSENAALRTPAGLAAIWLQPGAVPQYYPLTFTSFWIEYRLWGLDPAGYHAVNLVLHVLAALLLWRVLLVLRLPGAWAMAALFALHPVQVESVAWITERKNVLSGVLYLAALFAYLRFVDATGSGRRRWYMLSLICFAGALLGKTVTCSLPAALCLILWWRRGALRRADLLPLLPHFALGAGLAAVTVWMERHHVGAAGIDWQLSWIDRCLIAGRALWFYAETLAWPRDLTFIYPRWQIDAAAGWQYLYPVTFVGLLAALFGLRARLGRGPLVCVLLFAGTLLPALGFFDVFPMRYSFVADHYQYLACIPLFVLAVSVALAIGRRVELSDPRAGQAILAGVLLLLGALTWRQARVYTNAETLWRDTLAKNSGAWMAHNNLGLLLFARGDLVAASGHYEAALRIKPNDDFAHNNLGNVYVHQGDLARAEREFSAAIALAPHNAEARNNLGNVFVELQRWEPAAEQYEAALRSNPGYADAHNNLANVLAVRGDSERAIAHYRAAVLLDPTYADAHHNLAVLLASRGERDEAIAELRTALRLKPDYPQARATLDALLAQ